jgi:outer membrane receptor protein involved in Fe transport
MVSNPLPDATPTKGAETMRKALLLGASLALAISGLAVAQETTTGSIAGRVVDPQGAAVPGATVTVTTSQGERSVTTDQRGDFVVPYITPGTATVRVELAGFKTVEQKGVIVRLGQRVGLNFTLQVSQVQEVVEVLGESPVIDLSTTTVGGTLDNETLKHLPVGRNFTDTLYLVPGVSDSGGVGQANPAISGGSGLENNYIVDGVNITNAGYGGIGSYSIVFGSLGTGVTQDFIKETQVKTAGFEAEYGQSSGGVVNVVTQSGTNALHGSVFGYFRPSGVESSWKNLQTPNGTVNTTSTDNYDFGVTLGGPLVKDKLFFFGAFNPQYRTRTFIAPDGFPLKSLGPVDQKRRILSYAGKVTWQVNSNHRFDFSAFGDPSHGDNGPQRFYALRGTTTSLFSELKTYGGHNIMARYDGIITPSWFVEASFARAKNTIEEVPSENTYRVTDTTVTPNVITGGIGFYDPGNEGINNQYSFKSTNIFSAGGTHQLRYGIEYEHIDYGQGRQYTGPTFTLPDGNQTATGATISILAAPEVAAGKIYRVTRAGLTNVRQTKQRYLSFFAQDTWQIGRRLTIRPGVRYDQQHLIGTDNPPACHVGDSLPGAGDGSGPAVACEYTWKGNWAPRIGATYDIKGDGTSKIFASWGRFFVKIPNDLAARALAADASVGRSDYYDVGLTQAIPDGVPAAGVTTHYGLLGAHASTFANDTKSTYQDEFLGGIQFAVAGNVNVGVTYIHRTIPVILEDYQPAAVVAFDIACPGADTVEYYIDNISSALPRFTCPPTGSISADQAQVISQAAFEDPEHKYQAVELTANKIFSNNWSLVASYRWSKLEGNYEGFYRNDNTQSDPAITSLFDFPMNDPSYTQIGTPMFGYRGDIRYQGCALGCGVLPNDRTHQVKLFTNYAFSAVNVGVGLNVGSGKPLTDLAANPWYQNAGEIPVTTRGGGITTVADGRRDRAPMDFTVDAHLDYTVKLGAGRQRVMLIADAFNLFNRQTPTDYDYCSDRGFGAPNPNYGLAVNGCTASSPAYATPLQVRFGARLEW